MIRKETNVKLWCRLGWHQWGKYDEGYTLEIYSVFGNEDISNSIPNKRKKVQEAECEFCQAKKIRKSRA